MSRSKSIFFCRIFQPLFISSVKNDDWSIFGRGNERARWMCCSWYAYIFFNSWSLVNFPEGNERATATPRLACSFPVWKMRNTLVASNRTQYLECHGTNSRNLSGRQHFENRPKIDFHAGFGSGASTVRHIFSSKDSFLGGVSLFLRACADVGICSRWHIPQRLRTL